MMNHQSGQALPLAILALTIGSLVVGPFLGYASSDLIGSRVYGEAIAKQSACDAGVEHAIWSLTRGSLAEQFTAPGDEVTYQLSELINGMTTSVTVTANATGGGTGGEITDTAIDTLEYDTANGFEPSILNVTGNIYAIAYRGTSADGFLKTISIAANGDISNSPIDTLEYDTNDGREPCIIHVSGNTYAIAYRGTDDDGYIKTVSIASNGDIGNSPIDTLEFDTANGYEPFVIPVSGNVYAIAYRGPDNDGFLKTVSIDTNGDISPLVIDSLEFDTTNGHEPSLIFISGNVYAIAYRGKNNNGFLKTVSIATNGDIGSAAIDTLEFDTADGYEPSIINVSGNYYAIAYRGTSTAGYLKTVTIAPNGDIGNSVIDSFSFDSYSYEPRIINLSNGIFAIVYRGPSNRGDLKTISISAGGDIAGSAIDTLQFDSSSGYTPVIINISGSIYAIAYRGPSSDGFVKTVEITTTGGAAAYEIVARAGDRSIRAFVNTDNTTATIVSWQNE